MNSFNSPEQINDDEVDLYYIDQQLITNIMEHFYSLIVFILFFRPVLEKLLANTRKN